ncbi:hypothetical protein FT663_04977 [Candidozyma haemuli var. vulneris]|uniref:PCI domain-containing protein n=1 Tax=Candidozyma haemuli TaxID=45357 RepID=A0A2V1AMA4_9ASCO|nr:hypothetical protein CXQ85_001323 [[Candida] haemuloni]KAF3986229.1 hypothetical protein FT663_04977 [[Candida] haemuloni var. vulneris]KAF3986581.1 hypothetical protein FT662_04485 [[Candida] haemuloni var. vulneris]PVH19029.1 hypothetical protein CXQ85_001323 [[Candida] haemuloni]
MNGRDQDRPGPATAKRPAKSGPQPGKPKAGTRPRPAKATKPAKGKAPNPPNPNKGKSGKAPNAGKVAKPAPKPAKKGPNGSANNAPKPTPVNSANRTKTGTRPHGATRVRKGQSHPANTVSKSPLLPNEIAALKSGLTIVKDGQVIEPRSNSMKKGTRPLSPAASRVMGKAPRANQAADTQRSAPKAAFENASQPVITGYSSSEEESDGVEILDDDSDVEEIKDGSDDSKYESGSSSPKSHVSVEAADSKDAPIEIIPSEHDDNASVESIVDLTHDANSEEVKSKSKDDQHQSTNLEKDEEEDSIEGMVSQDGSQSYDFEIETQGVLPQVAESPKPGSNEGEASASSGTKIAEEQPPNVIPNNIRSTQAPNNSGHNSPLANSPRLMSPSPAATVEQNSRPAVDKKRPVGAYDSSERKRQRMERFSSSPQVYTTTPSLPVKRSNTQGFLGHSTALEKSFYRLTSEPNPANVRSPTFLQNCVPYVVNRYRTEGLSYHYINDQLKAIRQDLTIQHHKSQFTRHVYQTHIRIAIENADLGEFNQCLSQLFNLYAMDPANFELSEFIVYKILYMTITGNNPEINKLRYRFLGQEDIKVGKKSSEFDEWIRPALDLSTAVTNGDYYSVFKLYEKFKTSNKKHAIQLLKDHIISKQRFVTLSMFCKSFKRLSTEFLGQQLSLHSEDGSIARFLDEFRLDSFVHGPDIDLVQAKPQINSILEQGVYMKTS